MCLRNHYFMGLLPILLLFFLVLAVPTPAVVFADELDPVSPPDQCISCHENLYFLHDTGKWFCLREAPMDCVDCHGGDPTAISKDKAHGQRTAHPIVNESAAKCQECHSEESIERIRIFRDVAGISPVIVAAAYVPVLAASESDLIPATRREESFADSTPRRGVIFFLAIALILVLVLTGRLRRGKKTPQ